jgi:hypothetical protein
MTRLRSRSHRLDRPSPPSEYRHTSYAANNTYYMEAARPWTCLAPWDHATTIVGCMKRGTQHTCCSYLRCCWYDTLWGLLLQVAAMQVHSIIQALQGTHTLTEGEFTNHRVVF